MKIKKLGLVAATLLMPFGAQAATMGQFEVTSAVSERNNLSIGLWFETVLADGLSTVFEISAPGSFIADADGAVMTGSTANLSNAAAAFDFSFTYDRDFSDNTDTTPEFKKVWDDVTLHGNEDYFDFEAGTVTGTGGFAGLDFELERAPADGSVVHQTGGGILDTIGANQHNRNFGLSGWMSISAVSVDLNTCTLCTMTEAEYLALVGTQSDVNVDLSPASVPIPASGVLLLSAIFGGGALARRNRRKS